MRFIIGLLVILNFIYASEWIVDKKTGCKVLDSNPQKNQSIRWNGECLNNKVNGFGKLEWYVNDKIDKIEEGSFKNGLKEGTFKSFSNTGKLIYQINYKNNKKDGIYKSYYENGKLYYETPYINGERNGIEKWYYKSGQLHYETHY